MKIIVSKKVGDIDYTFEVEEEKEKEALAKAGFLSGMPTTCGVCGSGKIHLASNKAQGYVFIKMLCEECNARAQIGEYKDGGFFWKDWEKYEPPSKRKTPNSKEPPAER